MKQVTLNIPENKYSFFIKLVRSLDFVQIEEPVGKEDTLTPEQKETWHNIKAGFEELKMVDNEKLNARPIQALLDSLEE